MVSVSVAGSAAGATAAWGLGRGASFDDCVAVVRTAVDLGVNFIDTAGLRNRGDRRRRRAIYDRDKLVISTKAIFRAGATRAETVTNRVGGGAATARPRLRRRLPFPRRPSDGLRVSSRRAGAGPS